MVDLCYAYVIYSQEYDMHVMMYSAVLISPA